MGLTREANGDYEKAREFYLQALVIYQDIGDESGIADSHKNIGDAYWELEKYSDAIKHYSQAVSYFEKENNQLRIANTKINIGTSYYLMGSYQQAVDFFIACRTIYLKLNNLEGLANTADYLGRIYTAQGDDDIALSYYIEALKIYEDLYESQRNSDDLISSYNYIAEVYIKREQKDSALFYYNKSLYIGKENDDKESLALTYYNIAYEIKIKEAKWDEALHYLDLAQEMDPDNRSSTSSIWSLKSHIYLNKKDYATAKKYILKALEYHKTSGQKVHLKTDYLRLSTIQERKGDYKAALESYKFYKLYNDSLLKSDASNKIANYEFEKREEETEKRQKEEIRRKNIISYSIYTGLGVIIFLAAGIIYTFRLRNRNLVVEKQNLELQRREAELAKDTELFKSKFLSNISHEFRTPLTLINGHLEVLKKEEGLKHLRRFNEMEYSGRRLLQLINQLLDLTKMETGQYSLYYRKDNLLNEIHTYVQAFHSLAEERNITYTADITSAAEVKFSQLDFAYSSEALASIFNNLLSNALKFTPKNGSVHTTIDYINERLYIAVRDTGSGIAQKDLSNVFERFYQAHDAEDTGFEGSGIGLAIVKELSQLHGGNVEVVNNSEGGCTFSVWLSEGGLISEMADTQDIALPIYSPEVSDVDTDCIEDKPLILIVEDQRELRRFIVENLGSQYLILEAENGKQGIELAEEKVPDIIISDVMMPEMTGMELTKAIKANEITSHIPIVLLTAKAQHSDKMEGLAYGADEYLIKPFSIAELQLRVRNRLDQQEKLRQRFIDNPDFSNTESTPELNSLDSQFVEKLEKIIFENIENNIDVSMLASEIGLSNSQLTRKLKALMGVTPANFIKKLRVNIALDLLRDGYTVSEAAWKVGFEDPAYFSKVFKKHYGFLPSEAKT